MLKETLHLLKMNLYLRRYRYASAILISILFNITIILDKYYVLYPSIVNLISFGGWLAPYIFLIPSELTPLNPKRSNSTSLIYLFSVLKNKHAYLINIIFECILDSTIYASIFYKLQQGLDFKEYLLACLMITILGFTIKFSVFHLATISKIKTRTLIESKFKNMTRDDLIQFILVIISMIFFIRFIEYSSFSFFKTITDTKNLLFFIFYGILFCFLYFVTHHIFTTDKTPPKKIVTLGYKKVIPFFIISFLLADPYYFIYRQKYKVTANLDIITIKEFEAIIKKDKSIFSFHDSSKNNLLILAVKTKRYPLIKSLLNFPEANTLLNEKNSDNQTALIKASMGCHNFPTLKLLVDHGADVNIIDDNKRTALFYALDYKCILSVRYLLNYGANTKQLDKDGKNYYEYALNLKQKNISEENLIQLEGYKEMGLIK